MAPDLPAEADIVVIGAGPAGLAAAADLAAAGAGRVVVLDREAEPGGIPRHCGHSPYGLREFRRLMSGPAYAARLVAEARTAGAAVFPGVTVVSLHPGPRLTVTSAAGMAEITARRVLIATGVRETPRAARLIGGTKPGGVLTTGALQGLVYLDALRPFRRPVILGTELVAFSALLTCRHAGIRPVAMIEPSDRTTARWPAPVLPRLLRVPLLYGTEIDRIEGEETVSGVVLRDAQGRTTRLEADGVIVCGQFQPEATLVRGAHLRLDPATGGPEVDQFGRCSDPAFFAAGNVLRPVETAGACWAEGRAIARAILDSLKGEPNAPGTGARITVAGPVLKYALPQRISPDGAAPALPHVQLRARRPATGRILVHAGGHTLAAHAIDARPERRIELPLPAGIAGPIELSFEEEPS